VRDPASSCSSCGKLLAQAEILYAPNGDLICQACTTAAQVVAGHSRSAQMARNLAYGNVLLGLASFFCNPFFLLSAGAIGNGIYVVRRLRSDSQHGERVPDSARRKILGTVGAILGALGVLATLLRGAIQWP
jgi:hypothetical protein